MIEGQQGSLESIVWYRRRMTSVVVKERGIAIADRSIFWVDRSLS